MKKIYFIPIIFLTTIITACSSIPSNTTHLNSSHQILSDELSEQNKKIVVDFYEGVFLKHQVKAYADRYIGDQYIQQNQMYPMAKHLL